MALYRGSQFWKFRYARYVLLMSRAAAERGLTMGQKQNTSFTSTWATSLSSSSKRNKGQPWWTCRQAIDAQASNFRGCNSRAIS